MFTRVMLPLSVRAYGYMRTMRLFASSMAEPSVSAYMPCQQPKKKVSTSMPAASGNIPDSVLPRCPVKFFHARYNVFIIRCT